MIGSDFINVLYMRIIPIWQVFEVKPFYLDSNENDVSRVNGGGFSSKSKFQIQLNQNEITLLNQIDNYFKTKLTV